MRIAQDSGHDSSVGWSAGGTRSLAELLKRSSSKDDDELAYVIDIACRRGLVAITSLEEFFRLIPHLGERPVVLDAAIDAVIQVRRRAGEPRDALVRELQAQHPEHAEAIEVAAALSEVISGSEPPRGVERPSARELPEDLGPPTPDERARYSLRELLGSGSQGHVYLAVDRLMSRDTAPAYVAVKFLRGYVVRQADQRLVAEEAIKARRISHEFVARAIDRGVSASGEAFVVFEYVDGPSLEQRVRGQGPMAARDAVELIVKIARGMQAIHSAGLLHCDLKPSNVVLTRGGEPRITDFGLARWIAERGSADAGDGGYGAIGFAAPEQFEGSQPLTAACDVYALGGLLVYLLTSRVPNGETPEEARRNVFTGGAAGPLNAGAVDAVTEPVLRAICARALHRSPDLRHASADMFAADLGRWLAGEHVEWIPETRGDRLRRWLRRERRLVATACVAGAVAFGGMVWAGLLYSEVHTARVLADTSKAREQAEHERVEQFKTAFGSTLKNLDEVRKRGLDDQWLNSVTVMEALLGSQFLQPGAGGSTTWYNRIPVCLQLSGRSRLADGGHTVASLQYLTLAGIWEARVEQYDDALQHLSEATAGWRGMLPGDPMVDLSEKCWAATVVLAEAGGSTLDPGAGAEARIVLARPDALLTQKAGNAAVDIIKLAREKVNGPPPAAPR
ncbi:MAG: serine/threonine-protein kinase [Phycisphaerales bacterium]